MPERDNMDMVDEEKLDKKLAEWAGFKRSWSNISRDFAWSDSPDGHWLVDAPPNFTQSLDACFRWLVPKLGACSILSYGNGRYGAAIHYPHFEGDAETPALAFSLAIEQLIDEEATK